VIVIPVEGLSLGITHSSRVIEAEKEFVAEMADSFFKSLKRSIALILKGSITSFAALKVVLSRNIESIRDFGGDDSNGPRFNYLNIHNHQPYCSLIKIY